MHHTVIAIETGECNTYHFLEGGIGIKHKLEEKVGRKLVPTFQHKLDGTTYHCGYCTRGMSRHFLLLNITPWTGPAKP